MTKTVSLHTLILCSCENNPQRYAHFFLVLVIQPGSSGMFPNTWNVKTSVATVGCFYSRGPSAATRGKQTKGQNEATAFPSNGVTQRGSRSAEAKLFQGDVDGVSSGYPKIIW